MNSLKWVLIPLSGLLYAAAHTMSPWFWWLAFFWWAPLFYAAATERLSFKEGFVWGVCGIYGTMWGVFYSLTIMADGPFLIRAIPTFFTVIYLSLYAALWFWFSNRLIVLLSWTPFPLKRLALWMGTTVLFSWWMDVGCLWIFNAFEGCYILNPLLPLAEQTQFLALLPVLGWEGLTALLVATNGMVALLFLVPLHASLLLLAGISIPWVVGMKGVSHQEAPAWLSHVAVLSAWIYEPFDLTKIGTVVQEKLKVLLEKKPEVELVILPESSLYKCNLQSAQEIARAWSSRYLRKAVTLIVGAARWEKEHCYNTAYLLKEGKIEAFFDKRHRMLLTESLAPWWRVPFVDGLFEKSTHRLALSSNPRPRWNVLPGVSLVPYICSELFFNRTPDDPFSHPTMLMLCNDSWSSIQYVRRTMFLESRFKAVLWQRDILFSGYEHAHFCGKNGSLSYSLSYKV